MRRIRTHADFLPGFRGKGESMKSFNTLNWVKVIAKAFLVGVGLQLALMALIGLFFLLTGLPAERLMRALLIIGAFLFIPFQWAGLWAILEDTLKIGPKEGKRLLIVTGMLYGAPSGLIVATLLSFVLDLSAVYFSLILFGSPLAGALFGYHIWRIRAYRHLP